MILLFTLTDKTILFNKTAVCKFKWQLHVINLYKIRFTDKRSMLKYTFIFYCDLNFNDAFEFGIFIHKNTFLK